MQQKKLPVTIKDCSVCSALMKYDRIKWTVNLPLNVVVEHFIQYAVAVQMALYTFQMFWRDEDVHIFRSLVPKIELWKVDKLYRQLYSSNSLCGPLYKMPHYTLNSVSPVCRSCVGCDSKTEGRSNFWCVQCFDSKCSWQCPSKRRW